MGELNKLFSGKREAPRMAVSAIAFTIYPVTDIVRATEFYRNVVGLRRDGPGGGDYVEFAVGGGWFALGGPEIPCGAPGSAASLALEVDDLEAMRRTLGKLGTLCAVTFDQPTCFITSFRDPDGNTVFLHQKKERTA